MSPRRIALATLFVVAAAAGASIYSFTASKRYGATARVVVHPIAVTDKTYTGIDVLHATGDTPRDLGTAAHFFDTPEVISATATRLSLSPSQLRRSLDVHPLSGSNILLVVGKSASPQEAAQIANGIVQEAISQRTARVQAQVSAIITKLQSSTSPEAQRRVVDLQTLQGRSDPTLETLSTATAPTKASWPKPPLIISTVTLAALALAALFLVLPRLFASRRKAREVGVADRRRAAAIVQRERELAERRAELEQRPPEPEPVPVAEPEPEPEPEPVPVPVPEPEEARSFEVLEGSEKEAEPLPASEAQRRPGGWTIQALEQLVAERGNQFPDKVEEWQYYVVFLSEHAGADGALPASFDYLVEDTFADLL